MTNQEVAELVSNVHEQLQEARTGSPSPGAHAARWAAVGRRMEGVLDVLDDLRDKARWRSWEDEPPYPPRWVLGAIKIGGVWDVAQLFSSYRGDLDLPYSHWREIDPPTADVEWASASSIYVYVVCGGLPQEAKDPIFVTRNATLANAFVEVFTEPTRWHVEVYTLRNASTLSQVCGTEHLGPKALARVQEFLDQEKG